jgi:hypothetical protein
MRVNSLCVVTILMVGLWGCSKSAPPAAAPGPQATVTLQDGGSFTGTVTASSPTSITLASTSGESRTYPMGQVTSVQYSNPAPAAPVASAPVPAPAPAPSAPPPSSAPTAAAPPAPARPVAEFRTIPSGTVLRVRNNEPISSQTAQVGQTFSGVVAEDVVDTSGRLAIPRGSDATLVVREANDQGKVQGRSALAVDVGSVTVAGRRYRLDTADVVEQGREGVGANKRTGVFAGGGAALGGIIGALAGGGKGAAIGALSGAGAGTATQAVTRGKALTIPSETVMTFRLEAPVRIREMQ